MSGFNLAPHDLPATVRRSLQVSPNIEVRSAVLRIFHFASALFWFQVTSISDEKVQEIFPIGIGRYYGRLARTLEDTLRSAALPETRSYPYPNAPHLLLRWTLPIKVPSSCQHCTSRLAIGDSALYELPKMG